MGFLKSKETITTQPFQLGNLIEILQDGVCITNITGEIIYLNRAGYTMLGFEKTDLSQYNFFHSCIKNEDNISILKQQIHQTGLVRNFEIQLYRFTGGVLDVILTMNILKDYRQQVIGFLFLLKDITELKKIQQQLFQTQKLESIGLMASGIAHDFNNILAAIIPNAELIKLSLNESKLNYKRAEIIEKSAHRASDIASRLLTFTRQNDQKFEVLTNLNQIIKDSLELLENSIPENIRIVHELEPELETVRGDEAQLQQIIMNLIINAKDAMPAGGRILIRTENKKISTYYQVGSLNPGNYIKLTIKDSGKGIPFEVMPKIFDPFFTTKEVGKGSGLGLSVVYGITKSLNGHIEVSSKENIGTIFELYFPVSNHMIPRQEEAVNPIDQTNNFSFLVVDDEDYVLNILGDILEFLGHKVTKESNGPDAIDYYKNNFSKIDYVIVDLKMPKMDGKATYIELKRINPEIKIIFTSGFDDTPDSEKNLTDVAGFLKKPYSIAQVSQAINTIIKK